MEKYEMKYQKLHSNLARSEIDNPLIELIEFVIIKQRETPFTIKDFIYNPENKDTILKIVEKLGNDDNEIEKLQDVIKLSKIIFDGLGVGSTYTIRDIFSNIDHIEKINEYEDKLREGFRMEAKLKECYGNFSKFSEKSRNCLIWISLINIISISILLSFLLLNITNLLYFIIFMISIFIILSILFISFFIFRRKYSFSKNYFDELNLGYIERQRGGII